MGMLDWTERSTDVLQQGGGVLVPAGDIDALGEALRRVLTDDGLRARLSAEAPTVAAAWSPERSLSALTAVIRDAVSRPSRR